MEPLAKGFRGQADFCVVRDGQGLMVDVPDQVNSELRKVRLAH